jgi:Ca2+-transporting ATPase
MFIFNNKSHPTTVLITSYEAITGDQLTVDDLWQPRHAPSNLAHVLGQTINHANDPLDIALERYLSVRALLPIGHQPLREFHFTHNAGVSGTIWHHGPDYQLAVKGMPERVLEHCDMSENERELITMQVHRMSATGLYVLALATGTVKRSIGNVSDLKPNEKLSFVGLIGLTLGVSATARQCITSAKEKGIKVYFATGLHPVTTYHLANQLGLAVKPSDVYDARQLDTVNSASMLTIVSTTEVFARAHDKQKTELLHALKTIDKSAIAIATAEDLKKLLAN